MARCDFDVLLSEKKASDNAKCKMGYSFYAKLYKKINGILPDVYMSRGSCTKPPVLLPQVYGVGEVVKKNFIYDLLNL